MDIRDIAVRAAKTAVQAGLAVLTADVIANGLSDLAELSTAATAAGIAALAAGISVIHNAVLQWSNS